MPQWYGETVGFWDGDTLIAWTANVQGWTMSHSMFEFSSSLQVIEIIRRAPDGEGLVVEAVFYDPEAFARPFRIVTPWTRTGGIETRSGATTSSSAVSRTASCSGPTAARAAHAVRRRLHRLSSAGLGRRTGRSSSSKAGSGRRRSRRAAIDSGGAQQMQLTKRLAAALLAIGLCAGGIAQAQSTGDARQVVTRAAEALGGADRIQALKTIRLRGYGHDPYQDGGV